MLLYLPLLLALLTMVPGARPQQDSRITLYMCIHSCAMCVEHWERGLYNGPRCARQCVKHKGQRLVDPDCVKLSMFNYEPQVLKQHRKLIRLQGESNEDV